MVNARKHLTPAGSDTTVSRKTIFDDFGNSIRDVVPVANTTERSQLVTALGALTPTQAPSAARPLVVYRADAPGLHRLEATINGTTWVPASGALRFTDKSAADSWATTNAGYLSTNDRCFAGTVEYKWQGGWRTTSLLISAKTNGTLLPASTLTTAVSFSLPADAPAGRYRVTSSATTAGSADAIHYQYVSWDGVQLTDYLADYANVQGGYDNSMTRDSVKTAHAGGAATVVLQLRVNSADAASRFAQLTVEYIG